MKDNVKPTKVTPLMKQYNAIKLKYPDAILLFRIGDFYETFGEDAKKTARILDIVLTKRGAGSDSETALAGFPHHALDTYLPKLVKAGLRVAICDQLEDPKLTKKIVKRGVTELITPGVALNDEVLSSKNNNFLAAIHFDKTQIGIALLDISTGEFLIDQGNKEYLDRLLQNFSPSEILIQKTNRNAFQESQLKKGNPFYLEDWVFNTAYAEEVLTQHFKVKSLKGFGIEKLAKGIIAAGAILYYLSETHHKKLAHITKINRIGNEGFIWMDQFTIRNLELYRPQNEEAITLLDCLDATLTAMGARKLRRWLALPLTDLEKIKQRQQLVSFFVKNEDFYELVTQQLKMLWDIERLISKVATGKIRPREIEQLKNSLAAIHPIKESMLKSDNKALETMGDKLVNCELICKKIVETLVENAPILLAKGNVIAKGVSEELDELRGLATSGKSYLEDMIARETEQTGIPSLKIGFNSVFGYFIEVRNTHKDKVPEVWIRKQTLVNAERYITEELKVYEAKILGAEEKIAILEQSLYEELVQFLAENINPVQTNAQLIATLDCLHSFATTAIANGYVCPTLNTSTDLEILEGRHPVIEKQLPADEHYIANDLVLNQKQQQLIMITGPNMSGKSALLRQTALIVLLAQMGSFVPARQAKIGIVDKIFTRVGASDNISMGESTFMVEMNETASILNNISKRSLILLDEIGRGTSTYDGISIAWAIASFLHEHPTKPKTLFATHYHELNNMATTFERIKNFNVSIKELKDNVVFLRKLEPGGSKHSFGIHVAKLAGMPATVIENAKKLLHQLELKKTDGELKEIMETVREVETQQSFYNLNDPLLEEIKEGILHTDINTLTPVEALMKLNEIKNKLIKGS